MCTVTNPVLRKGHPQVVFHPATTKETGLDVHTEEELYTVSPPLENKSSLNRPCTERNIDRMFRGRMEQPFTWKLEETVCVEL